MWPRSRFCRRWSVFVSLSRCWPACLGPPRQRCATAAIRPAYDLQGSQRRTRNAPNSNGVQRYPTVVGARHQTHMFPAMTNWRTARLNIAPSFSGRCDGGANLPTQPSAICTTAFSLVESQHCNDGPSGATSPRCSICCKQPHEMEHLVQCLLLINQLLAEQTPKSCRLRALQRDSDTRIPIADVGVA